MAIQVLSAPVSSFGATQTQSLPKGVQAQVQRAQSAFNLNRDTFESPQNARQNGNVRSNVAGRSFFSDLRDQFEGFVGKAQDAVSDAFSRAQNAADAVEHFFSPSNDAATTERTPAANESSKPSTSDGSTKSPTSDGASKASTGSSSAPDSSAASGSEGSSGN